MRRTISTPLGADRLTVHDVVANRSDRTQPHMVRYHCNLGWPLRGPEAVVRSPSSTVTPAYTEALEAGTPWNSLAQPRADARNLVFLHALPEAERAVVTAENYMTGVRLEIAFDTGTLPWMHSWKVLRHQQYVLGIEPANCPTMTGRARAEEDGTLPVLEPGEKKSYTIDVRFRV
ncbi:hypothetical protein DEO23_13545 [Brachybacterium endophyticum]|uniref:DUF4432 domain-containing protein n=1 Tax=Brachybacterium endophyticum TaxID=2182385 RepID=A0A2U2RIG6_9MICO|nr:hypothetical protein DEO23_13545 [Brachybacterium endophyticum]